MNQPLLVLKVKNGSDQIYSCNATREGCRETERVKVEFLTVDESTLNITVAVKNLTVEDSGNYTIVFETQVIATIFTEEQGEREELTLRYHLNVTGGELVVCITF